MKTKLTKAIKRCVRMAVVAELRQTARLWVGEWIHGEENRRAEERYARALLAKAIAAVRRSP